MSHTNPHRGYRVLCARHNTETQFRVVVEESDLWITAGRDLRFEAAAVLSRLRGDIKNWILLFPKFGTSLIPLEAPDSAPEIVRRMCRAAQAAGVGPFAAVAGAVAQMLAEELLPLSPDLIVENGGDTYICSTRSRNVGLLPDPEAGVLLSDKVSPSDCPVSFCASSGRIGHSLSFGLADLVVARARDAALADTFATALANMLRSENDIPAVLKRARFFARHGLDGFFGQCNGKIALWGNMELAGG